MIKIRKKNEIAIKKLTSKEERVIINKDIEPPFSEKYENFFEDGIYICKRCGTPLYLSESKFHSG